MKWLYVFLVLAGGAAQAENSICADLYRQRYLRESSTPNSVSQATKEASLIYQIYFDHTIKVQQAYDAAEPILSALAVPQDRRIQVLDLLIAKMDSSELCPSGQTLLLVELVNLLRSSLP